MKKIKISLQVEIPISMAISDGMKKLEELGFEIERDRIRHIFGDSTSVNCNKVNTTFSEVEKLVNELEKSSLTCKYGNIWF